LGHPSSTFFEYIYRKKKFRGIKFFFFLIKIFGGSVAIREIKGDGIMAEAKFSGPGSGPGFG